MQAKQVYEISEMLDDKIEIFNLKLIIAERNKKKVWNLLFEYNAGKKVEQVMLVSQHNKPRYWATSDTAIREIHNIFPNQAEIIFSLENY